jgi:hypothetical protein
MRNVVQKQGRIGSRLRPILPFPAPPLFAEPPAQPSSATTPPTATARPRLAHQPLAYEHNYLDRSINLITVEDGVLDNDVIDIADCFQFVSTGIGNRGL